MLQLFSSVSETRRETVREDTVWVKDKPAAPPHHPVCTSLGVFHRVGRCLLPTPLKCNSVFGNGIMRFVETNKQFSIYVLVTA